MSTPFPSAFSDTHQSPDPPSSDAQPAPAKGRPRREGNDSLWKRAKRTLGTNSLTFLQPQSRPASGKSPDNGVVLIWNNIVHYRPKSTHHETLNLAVYQRAISGIMLTFCFGKKRRPLSRAQQNPENVGNKSGMLRGGHLHQSGINAFQSHTKY